MNIYLLDRSAGYGEIQSVIVVAESEDQARMFAVKANRSLVEAMDFLFESDSSITLLGTADARFDEGHVMHQNVG